MRFQKAFSRALEVFKRVVPFPPTFFIMLTEALSRITRKAKNGFLSDFVVEIGEVSISNLQYANDTIIFCDVDLRQVSYLRCVLSYFEVVLSLKINIAKSDIF